MSADYFADYADVSEPVIWVLQNLPSNPRNLREIKIIGLFKQPQQGSESAE